MAEETAETTEQTSSAAGEASKSEVTFSNLSEIDLSSSADEEREQVDEKPSDTPSESSAELKNDKDDEPATEPDDDTDDSPPQKSEKESEEESEDGADDEPVEGEPDDGRDKIPKPARQKLRQLEKIDKGVLAPLRDPGTPITEAFASLAEYITPERAGVLAQEAAAASIATYPDQWLARILGDDKATVESVKARLNGDAVKSGDNTPSKEIASEFDNLYETPESKELVKYLTEEYGEEWKDPKNDSSLDELDLPAVRAFRAQQVSFKQMKDTIDAQNKELESLKPAVDSIQSEQKSAYEKGIQQSYQSIAQDYQSGVEKKAFESVFSSEGLTISDSDDDVTKGLKESLQSAFKPYSDDVPGRFETFAVHKFSDKDNLIQVIKRVDGYLLNIAQLKADAKREKDTGKAQKMLTSAETLQSHADSEKATLTVLTKLAGKEFLEKEAGPMKAALEEIKNLRRQLKGNLRTEVVDGDSTGKGPKESVTFDNLRGMQIR